MKVLFFDVGYTLVNEDAVWEKRCHEQAETQEAKKLGLSAADIYHEIEIASIARKPQFRTLIDKYNFKEVAPYQTELETLYDDAPAVIKALSQKYELGIIANQLDGLKDRLVKTRLWCHPETSFKIRRAGLHHKQSYRAFEDILATEKNPIYLHNSIALSNCKSRLTDGLRIKFSAAGTIPFPSGIFPSGSVTF